MKSYAPQHTELHNIVSQLCALQKKNFYKLNAKIIHKGHYYHERSVDVTAYNGDIEPIKETLDSFIEILVDFNRWIYSQLEKGNEWYNSEACIKEDIEANDYLFNEAGEIDYI